MVFIRTATDALAKLKENAIRRALQASIAARTMGAFYKIVDMRNPSRSYFIRFEGRLHSLKAVVTKALREERPETVAYDFQAAKAAERLRELRFEVVHNDSKAENERQRVWISRLDRKEQTKFRERVIDLYGKCAFSNCATLQALEAAHVNPVKKNGIDDPGNGILLRADLHKLFDTDLIAINPVDGCIHVAAKCRHDYGDLFRNVTFEPPPNGPALTSFKLRWLDFNKIKDD